MINFGSFPFCCGVAMLFCGVTTPKICNLISARTDFQIAISPSLLVGISRIIRRWKALSKIFNLICTLPYKSSMDLLQSVLQATNEIFFHSNCSKFHRFCSGCSNLFSFDLNINKTMKIT